MMAAHHHPAPMVQGSPTIALSSSSTLLHDSPAVPPREPNPPVASALPAAVPTPQAAALDDLVRRVLLTPVSDWCTLCRNTRQHRDTGPHSGHRWCPFCAARRASERPGRAVATIVKQFHSTPDSFLTHLSACAPPDPSTIGPHLRARFDSWGVRVDGAWTAIIPPPAPTPVAQGQGRVGALSSRPTLYPAPGLCAPPALSPALPPAPARLAAPPCAIPPASQPSVLPQHPADHPQLHPAAPPQAPPPGLLEAHSWLGSVSWIGMGPRPAGPSQVTHLRDASRVAEHGSVLQAIPPDLLGLWKHALTQWASRWEAADTDATKLDALHALLLAPCLALPKPTRGGKKGRSRDMRRAIHQWVGFIAHEDPAAQLEAGLAPAEDSGRRRRLPELDRRYKRAQWLVPKGRISQASRAIEALTPLSATDAQVKAQLDRMIPARDETLGLPALPAGQRPPPRLRADDGELRVRVDRCLARTSAAGPSGLEFAHLRVLTCGEQDLQELHRAYSAFLDLIHWIMCGLPGKRASALLLSHRMTVIRKKEGSDAARAIMVGEVLVRTAALLLMHLVVAPAREIFSGVQYSVGEPGGSQVVFLILRTLLGATPEHTPGGEGVIAIPIDISGAFYNVSRAICLQRLFSYPALSPIWPMVRWMLATAAPVFAVEDGGVVGAAMMTTGVGVGWVFGSLLFCLSTIQELRQIRAEFPLVHVKAVTDNITLVGPPSDTIAAASRLSELLHARGDLTLNAAHNKVLWLAEAPVPPVVSAYAHAQRGEVVTLASGTYSLLGVPVGEPEAVARAVQEDWAAGASLRHAVLDAELDACTAWQLNSMVVSTRPGYLLRTLHPAQSLSLATALAAHQRSFLEERAGIPTDEQTPTVAAQSKLPLRDGGLGWPDMDKLPAESFASAFAATAPHLAKLGDDWQSAVTRSAWLNSALQAATDGTQGVSLTYAALLPPRHTDLSRPLASTWMSFFAPPLADRSMQPEPSAARQAAPPAAQQPPDARADADGPAAPASAAGPAAAAAPGPFPVWAHADRPPRPDEHLKWRLDYERPGNWPNPELVAYVMRQRPGVTVVRTMLGVLRPSVGRCELVLAPEREGDPTCALDYALVLDIWRVHWRVEQEKQLQDEFVSTYLPSLDQPRAVTEVLGDGNCALRCVETVVGKPFGEIRAELATHLAAHPHDLNLCWHSGAAGHAGTAAAYLSIVSRDRSFVGLAELAIISRLLGRTIRIFSARRPTPFVINAEDALPRPPVELLHCGVDAQGEGNHFDLVRARRPDEVAPPLQALRQPPQSQPAVVGQGLQADLATARHARGKVVLLQRIREERGAQGVVRFEAAQGSLPAALLTCFRKPVFPCPVTRISHRAFRCALRLRLGLSPLPLNVPGFPLSCLCGQSLTSVAATHLLSCAKLAKARGDTTVRRHDLIRDVFAWAYRRAGLSVQVEPPLSNETNDRADIIFHDLNNVGYLVDVTVRDATQKSQTSSLAHFLLRMEGSKTNHYAPFARQRSLHMAPVVLDVGGCPSATATKLTVMRDIALNEPHLVDFDGGRRGFLACFAWAVSAAIATVNQTMSERSWLAIKQGAVPVAAAPSNDDDDDDVDGGGDDYGRPAGTRGGAVRNSASGARAFGPDGGEQGAEGAGGGASGAGNIGGRRACDDGPAGNATQPAAACLNDIQDISSRACDLGVGGRGVVPSFFCVLERSLAVVQPGKASDRAGGGKADTTALLTRTGSFSPAGVLDGRSFQARCSWDAASAVPATASPDPWGAWSARVNLESGGSRW